MHPSQVDFLSTLHLLHGSLSTTDTDIMTKITKEHVTNIGTKVSFNVPPQDFSFYTKHSVIIYTNEETYTVKNYVPDNGFMSDMKLLCQRPEHKTFTSCKMKVSYCATWKIFMLDFVKL
jgi:hypothetical protein